MPSAGLATPQVGRAVELLRDGNEVFGKRLRSARCRAGTKLPSCSLAKAWPISATDRPVLRLSWIQGEALTSGAG